MIQQLWVVSVSLTLKFVSEVLLLLVRFLFFLVGWLAYTNDLIDVAPNWFLECAACRCVNLSEILLGRVDAYLRYNSDNRIESKLLLIVALHIEESEVNHCFLLILAVLLRLQLISGLRECRHKRETLFREVCEEEDDVEVSFLRRLLVVPASLSLEESMEELDWDLCESWIELPHSWILADRFDFMSTAMYILVARAISDEHRYLRDWEESFVPWM